MKVIDVSEWNGSLYWEKMKKDNIKGVIVRAGYGRNNEDPYFIENVEGALSRGLHVGIYWFMYCATVEQAKQEARNLHELIKPYKGKLTLPIYADYEYDSDNVAVKNGYSVNSKLRTDMIIAFLEVLKSYGWLVGVYGNYDYIVNKWEQSRLNKYELWYADWRDEPSSYWVKKSGIHQYTEQGPKYGEDINQSDVNIVFKDYPTIIKTRGYNGFKVVKSTTSKTTKTTKTTKTAKKTNTEIAREVLKGYWGNGEARILKLKKSGYDYNEIQKIVNKLVSEKEYVNIAKRTINGDFGNGEERKRNIERLGYDYYKVQEIVNKLV